MSDIVFHKCWKELETLDQSSLPRLHLCFVQAAKSYSGQELSPAFVLAGLSLVCLYA